MCRLLPSFTPACPPGGRAWRRPTPLPSTGLGHFTRPQAALDKPALWHHGPRYREGIRCIHYAEDYQLHQFMAPAIFVFLHCLHPFDLCDLRHFKFCPMQPSASIVNLRAWGYVLGSQSCIRLCNIWCEYAPLFALDESKYGSTLMPLLRL